MKPFLSMLAAAVALAATQAAAQGVDLTGQYRCVQMCRAEGQPAFITQSGWEMNLRNEAGEPSRGWFDRVGRIWVQSWNEGATVSEDGTFIWFDRGTVWQRDWESRRRPDRSLPAGSKAEQTRRSRADC